MTSDPELSNRKVQAPAALCALSSLRSQEGWTLWTVCCVADAEETPWAHRPVQLRGTQFARSLLVSAPVPSPQCLTWAVGTTLPGCHHVWTYGTVCPVPGALRCWLNGKLFEARCPSTLPFDPDHTEIFRDWKLTFLFGEIQKFRQKPVSFSSLPLGRVWRYSDAFSAFAGLSGEIRRWRGAASQTAVPPARACGGRCDLHRAGSAACRCPQTHLATSWGKPDGLQAAGHH